MQIKAETAVGFFILASLGAFFYMTLQVGVFRFDKSSYNPYYALFKDIAGLSKKAEVKIAGVKVGWIEDIVLINGGKDVQTKLMVRKDFQLYADAQAMVRQEGLIGSKFVEIAPGDPLLPPLPAGSELSKRSREVASFEDVLESFKGASRNVEAITHTIKDALGGQEAPNKIQEAVSYFADAAKKIAGATEMLERMLMRNEENVNAVMSDVRVVAQELRDHIPDLSRTITRLAEQLNTNILPQVSSDVHSVAQTLSSDFLPRTAESAQQLAQSVRDASVAVQALTGKAQQGLQNITEFTDKINNGEGLLGKIINEDCVYNDLAQAASSLRNTLSSFNNFVYIVDGHFECLRGMGHESAHYRDNKGYLNLRIHPNPEHYLLLGAAFSQEGYVKRKITYYKYCNEQCDQDTALHGKSGVEEIRQKRNSARLNLQFGKIWNDFAARVGIFEGTAGGAVDWVLPFNNDLMRWVSTFEAFDFRGKNRLHRDHRPHLKWMNKMYVTPNLYLVWGLDDFISRRTKSGFIGAGLRFSGMDVE